MKKAELKRILEQSGLLKQEFAVTIMPEKKESTAVQYLTLMLSGKKDIPNEVADLARALLNTDNKDVTENDSQQEDDWFDELSKEDQDLYLANANLYASSLDIQYKLMQKAIRDRNIAYLLNKMTEMEHFLSIR